jgi:UDP-glucuronate 4-epimerase
MCKPILVTGAAGFIGFAFARRMLELGRRVVGVDSINDYYDPRLKRARLDVLGQSDSFTFRRIDLAERETTAALFREFAFDTVVHLAAQAGVRYSIANPHAYLDANLAAFLNVLEGCRHSRVGHLMFASSSSVYGESISAAFSTASNVDHPISLYAATKKANELMAHAYSHLYRVPATGLRFFTVYGPWGRPDMAIFSFAAAMERGEPIRLFNYGRMRRDFTYIDDVVEAMVRLSNKPPAADASWCATAPSPATSAAPWRIYNIGNGRPVELLRIVTVLEAALGRRAIVELAPLQAGDVLSTGADVDDLANAIDFRPTTTIEDGLHRFVAWFRGPYRDVVPASAAHNAA